MVMSDAIIPLPEQDPRFAKIYHLGEQRFWTPQGSIDWTLPYNTETPRYFRWAWRYFEPFKAMSKNDQDEFCYKQYKWAIDQGVHGESFGIVAAGILSRHAETDGERMLACELAMEEARHYEALRTLAEKFGPIGPPHPVVLDTVAWAEKQGLLGVFIALHAGERAGVPGYSLLARFGGPLFKAVYGRIAEDETRHLGFGALGVQRYSKGKDPNEVISIAQRVLDGYSQWANPSPVWEPYDFPGVEEYWSHFHINSRLRLEILKAFHNLDINVV